MYSKAQAKAAWTVRVLPTLEDDKDIQASASAIEQNVEQYMLRWSDLAEPAAVSCSSLPEHVSSMCILQQCIDSQIGLRI